MRDARGRFTPGQSGNPEGRRIERENEIAPVRDLARTKTPAVIEALFEIATTRGYRGADRVDACRTLLEFGWGKPPVAVFETQAEEGMTWERLLAMVTGEGETAGVPADQ